jgi:hypothetical protein
MTGDTALRGSGRLPLWAAGVMVGLVAVRVGLAAAAFDPAWSALTWDDFTRVALAREWAADPYFTIPGFLVWLPAHTWILGSVFALAGGAFAGDPMLLSAIVNTACIVAAAALVGHAGRTLFASVTGGLVVFAAILFSPWGWFTGLSGLSEPMWYLMVAAAVAAFVTWHTTRSTAVLAAGSVAVAVGAALRYEGWFLAAVWVLAVAYWSAPRPFRPATAATALARQFPVLGVAAAPLLVPVGWLGVNLVETGDPFSFIAESARTFEAAYGAGPGGGPIGLLTYYPASLARSAPLLLAAIAAAAAAARRVAAARALLGLVGGHFALFYVTSVLSLGAFTERFTFTFALALSPLLAVFPQVLGRIPARAVRRAVAVAVMVAAAGVTLVRIADRPVEWTHPPDLLALADDLDEIAPSTADPLVVGLGPGMGIDRVPLAVANGERVTVVEAPDASAAAPPPGVEVWVERLPERVLATTVEADAVVGRYHLYGAAADDLPAPTEPCCAGWSYVTETGVIVPVVPSEYMGLEFLGDDPPPGSEARLTTGIDRGDAPRAGTLRVRWLYGHGFNEGRIDLVVRLDGVALFRTDIAAMNRWVDVGFEVPAGSGTSLLEVAVVALPGIEPGWGWGRASTVLVESVDLG